MVLNALRAWSDGGSMADPVAGSVLPETVLQTSPMAIITAPREGVCRNMFARISQAPGGVLTTTFALYKNEVLTALALTITGAATDGSNVVDSVIVAKGDRLTVVPGGAGLDAQGSRVDIEFV